MEHFSNLLPQELTYFTSIMCLLLTCFLAFGLLTTIAAFKKPGFVARVNVRTEMSRSASDMWRENQERLSFYKKEIPKFEREFDEIEEICREYERTMAVEHGRLRNELAEVYKRAILEREMTTVTLLIEGEIDNPPPSSFLDKSEAVVDYVVKRLAEDTVMKTQSFRARHEDLRWKEERLAACRARLKAMTKKYCGIDEEDTDIAEDE
jgi:radical SAM superfamily enzyme with C-terminal helix-hairpin-helix motif